MTPPTSPVHVLAGPPRARLLGVLGWALSRVAVAVAGVAAAQMLRADAYPTVTAVLVAVALAPSAVLLLLAHEVH
ncbi:hypothetical protein Q9R32_10995, partial [Actinotalea sp. AC32]|nr:hypothetical protein [Actinotalea sp. AC32]